MATPIVQFNTLTRKLGSTEIDVLTAACRRVTESARYAGRIGPGFVHASLAALENPKFSVVRTKL